jgi:ABC-type nickel/cobalt efflux system permease component RcnA
LGFLGVGFGWAVGDLVVIEGQRGTVAGWLLLSFGIVYFLWGLKQGLIRKTHTHHHQHAHGIDHTHEADPPHASMHAYEHLSSRHQDRNGTPWWLFLIFVFGPCEPLIPVLMYPAVQKDVTTLMLVTLAFSVVTVATMMSVVTLAYKGLNWIRVDALERWTHALAGGSIALVAAGMVFFGW